MKSTMAVKHPFGVDAVTVRDDCPMNHKDLQKPAKVTEIREEKVFVE